MSQGEGAETVQGMEEVRKGVGIGMGEVMGGDGRRRVGRTGRKNFWITDRCARRRDDKTSAELCDRSGCELAMRERGGRNRVV